MCGEMSDISEDHYAAGWMHGLEHTLWDAVQRLPEKTDYGMGQIDTDRLRKLKAASELVGGWIVYDDKLVPMDEWLAIQNARKKPHPVPRG